MTKKTLHHLLDKDIQRRDFGFELGFGKGAHRRKETKQSRQLYRDNYDKIFSKSK